MYGFPSGGTQAPSSLLPELIAKRIPSCLSSPESADARRLRGCRAQRAGHTRLEGGRSRSRRGRGHAPLPYHSGKPHDRSGLGPCRGSHPYERGERRAVGAPASEGIRLIAEDGLEATAVAELTGPPGIFDVVDIVSRTNRVGGGAPLPNPQMVEITAAANTNRLSLAVMLICTNDGFTGVSGVKLPGRSSPRYTRSARGTRAWSRRTSGSSR